MRPNDVFEQRTVKLISFAIDEREFTIQQALNVSNMRPEEFFALSGVIFTRDDIAHGTNRNKVLDWHLRPDALFGYLSLQQYKHSSIAPKLALLVATLSVVIFIASLFAVLGVF